MNCQACKGACCESIVLHVTASPEVMPLIQLRSRAHGVLEGDREFGCACSALREGRCALYGQPERPGICSTYEVGGIECLETVYRRRTPNQYEDIREPGDPETHRDLPKAIHDLRNKAFVLNLKNKLEQA